MLDLRAYGIHDTQFLEEILQTGDEAENKLRSRTEWEREANLLRGVWKMALSQIT
jgi:hypothetical protein